MADSKVTQLSTENTDPQPSDLLYIVDDPSGTPSPQKIKVGNLLKAGGGWMPINATLTYSSADDPIYVISSNADLSSEIQVGDKVKFTNNSTTFYGIINALGSWSGSAQLITLHGGTDYDVANSAITAPYYSKAASPQGFPTSPAKWSYTAVNDANDHYKTSPTATTLYGGLNDYTTGADITFDAPIGLWKPRLACSLSMQNASARSGVKVAISTGNNSISDPALTASCSGYDNLTVPVYKEFSPLAVASKTTYYVLITTPDTGVDKIALWGSTFSPTVITLVSAYL